MSRRSSPDTAIGERIRIRRLSRGWSVRHAADRSGISHATWSRIERGKQTADNRFVLAAIAAALECPLTDLTTTRSSIYDRQVIIAQASVPAIRQTLLELDGPAPPIRQIETLAREADLVRELWQRCDYAGALRLLPTLIRDLHACGPHDRPAQHLLCEAVGVASSIFRAIGYPSDAWLAAERCHAVADASGDPVLLGYAAFKQAEAARTCGSQRRCLKIAEDALEDLPVDRTCTSGRSASTQMAVTRTGHSSEHK